MTTRRMFKEKPVQGEDEVISYYFSSTPWGTNPTNVSVVVFDITDATSKNDWQDVTTTVLPVNTPDITDDVITLSPLQALTDAHIYRVEVAFTVAEMGDVEAYAIVVAGE